METPCLDDGHVLVAHMVLEEVVAVADDVRCTSFVSLTHAAVGQLNSRSDFVELAEKVAVDTPVGGTVVVAAAYSTVAAHTKSVYRIDLAMGRTARVVNTQSVECAAQSHTQKHDSLGSSLAQMDVVRGKAQESDDLHCCPILDEGRSQYSHVESACQSTRMLLALQTCVILPPQSGPHSLPTLSHF